jgi:transcription initiation factor IIE alpha subunit
MKNVHDNSIECYHGLNTSERRRMIMEVYEGGLTKVFTDREIAYALGTLDMNYVRPRITELIRDGFLIECGKVKDNSTGKTVRIVKLNDSQA